MTEIQGQVVSRCRKFNILAYITVPLALFVGGNCLWGMGEKGVGVISLLPFTYMLGVLWISYKNTNINGLAYNIIHVVMFIRYVFLVYVTVTTQNYVSSVVTNSNFKQAIFLMIYEMIVVFVVIRAFSARNVVENYLLYDDSKRQNDSIMRLFITVCIAIFFAAIVIYPEARNQLFNFSSAVANTSVDSGSLNGFFFVFFTIGMSLLYGVIINWIRKIRTSQNFLFLLSCIVSALYISCSWTSGTGSVSRWGLIAFSLVSYCVLIKAFPQKKNILLIIGGCAFIWIIIASSITKLFLHHGASSAEALVEIFSAEYLNEYFQGIFPVEKAISAMNAYRGEINLVTFLDDIMSSYPIINHLFYQEGNSTAQFYLAYIGRTDKIIPTVTQGYAFFRTFGAPFFSGVLTFLALKCDRLIKNSTDVFSTIVFSSIAIWCSMFMAVNVTIIHRQTMYFVIVLIVMWIDKHVKLRGRLR